jgi:hypothetical protein
LMSTTPSLRLLLSTIHTPDQDMARHQRGDDPALAHLTPYPGFNMTYR